jgi:hypothetical protein
MTAGPVFVARDPITGDEPWHRYLLGTIAQLEAILAYHFPDVPFTTVQDTASRSTAVQYLLGTRRIRGI